MRSTPSFARFCSRPVSREELKFAVVLVGTYERAEDADVLLADEARHNLILGLAGTLRDQPGRLSGAGVLARRGGGRGRRRGRCGRLRTDSCSHSRRRRRRSRRLRWRSEALPGSSERVPEASDFGRVSATTAGAAASTALTQGIYALERVCRRGRRPGPRDRRLSATASSCSTGCAPSRSRRSARTSRTSAELQRIVDHRLGVARDGFVLWEVDGQPVSLAGFGARRRRRSGSGRSTRRPSCGPWLRERAGRGRLAGAPRRGQALLLPLHRPRRTRRRTRSTSTSATERVCDSLRVPPSGLERDVPVLALRASARASSARPRAPRSAPAACGRGSITSST